VNTKCVQVLLANITNTKADLPQMPQPHLHHWLGAELQKLSGPWQGFAQELKALPYQFAGVHAHSRDVAVRPSKASHKSLVDGLAPVMKSRVKTAQLSLHFGPFAALDQVEESERARGEART
jgi:hypothetical protein